MKPKPAPPVLNSANQKLVTIYLDNATYARGKMLVGSFAEKHGLVEEHLTAYLSDGWSIQSVSSFGGCDGLAVRAGSPSFSAEVADASLRKRRNAGKQIRK